MPRRPRLTQPGCSFHLIQRGNNRSACFFDASDYRLYLELLGRAARDHGVAVHAFVLMTNHVHLLITSEAATGPSRMMKQLGQRYVQRLNRAHGRSGTLWEGRFRSCLVGEEDYFLGCSRYIEMNPVRAGMAGDPADYPWSSHRINAWGADTLGEAGALLTPHPLMLALGPTVETRLAAWRELFHQAPDPRMVDDIRAATNGGYVLGSERFQREIAAITGRRTWRGLPGRPPRTEAADDRQDRLL